MPHVPSLTAAPVLPATLALGAVHLTVSDLDRSLTFYREALGLQVHGCFGETARLSVGEADLLVLTEEPGARPAGLHAGLYHFALLFATREELARAAVRLAATQTPIEGASDHGVSEAIYLSDPDGNGIELYADRPRDRWPAPQNPGARIGMYTIALDMPDLLGVVQGEAPRTKAGPGLRVGHVHLHVGDLATGLGFYRDLLGFQEMVLLPGAAFVAAGGYHHHLGFNEWRGKGVPPAPAGTVGLRRWTVLLDDPEQIVTVGARLERSGAAVARCADGVRVRDPWDIPVVFELSTPSGNGSD